MQERTPPKDPIGRIASALTSLAAKEGAIGEATKTLTEKLASDHIRLTPATGETPSLPTISSATHFDLLHFRTLSGINTIQALLYNPTTVASTMNDRALEADLVRTILLANSFPDKYADRLTNVYSDILDAQSQWINEQPDLENVVIPNDPRGDRNLILQAFLQDEALTCDMGFDDWESALNEGLIVNTHDPIKMREIQKLKDSGKKGFIVARHVNTKAVYTDIMTNRQLRNGFLQMNADDRAATSASRLLNSLI